MVRVRFVILYLHIGQCHLLVAEASQRNLLLGLVLRVIPIVAASRAFIFAWAHMSSLCWTISSGKIETHLYFPFLRAIFSGPSPSKWIDDEG